MKKNKVNKSALAREFNVSRASVYYQPKMKLRDERLREQILSRLPQLPGRKPEGWSQYPHPPCFGRMSA